MRNHFTSALHQLLADKTRLQRLLWFVGVGCCAAWVHWCVVVGLVGQAMLTPLVANIVGWLVAFTVSFAGHYRLTFRGHRTGLLTSIRRFFMVSALGFCINELAYAVLLHVAPAQYAFMLAIVLVLVAVLTYVLSQRWAFLRNPD